MYIIKNLRHNIQERRTTNSVDNIKVHLHRPVNLGMFNSPEVDLPK
jgi:hypothetical protein